MDKKKEKIVVTGNEGYIGSVLTEQLVKRGYYVVGIDAGIFRKNVMGERVRAHEQVTKDIRDVEVGDIKGSQAIIHLAGLSNDPLGELAPGLTLDINYRASVRLAEIAKEAEVERFLFSSSCSMYGASGGEIVDEEGEVDPRTVYAKSKAKVEREVKKMSGSDFSATFLRNATVFGYSPRLRLDLVVNNLTASGFLKGIIEVLSDGTPWRPNLHVRDCANAFIYLMEQSLDMVEGRSFNIGMDESNLQVKNIANKVAGKIEGAEVDIKGVGSPDERTYRVSFEVMSKLGWRGNYKIDDGVVELIKAFGKWGLTDADFADGRYNTLHRYKEMIEKGEMDKELRVKEAVSMKI